MDMIVDQNPSKNLGSRGIRELTEAREKFLANRILPKDSVPFDSSRHHVVEGSGII
jgi:hypothetical protein